MKMTDQTRHVDRLKEDVINTLEYYMELDEVGNERFLNMIHDHLHELITYHKKQIDKAEGLRDRLAGHRSVNLENLQFPYTDSKKDLDERNNLTILGLSNSDTDTISIGNNLDDKPYNDYHSDYFWDFDRNK